MDRVMMNHLMMDRVKWIVLLFLLSVVKAGDFMRSGCPENGRNCIDKTVYNIGYLPLF
jgi:hypothetical protein